MLDPFSLRRQPKLQVVAPRATGVKPLPIGRASNLFAAMFEIFRCEFQ
jgi:hypothetical protein